VSAGACATVAPGSPGPPGRLGERGLEQFLGLEVRPLGTLPIGDVLHGPEHDLG